MQGFPMDSHVTWTKDPDTGAVMPEFDRAVTSEPLRKYIKGVITNGVLPNPSNNLQVSAGTNGMTVVVQAGFCVIEGGLAIEPNTRTLEVTAADSTYDRIDTVVARWDANDASRKVDLHIRAGVPASSPVRPTLTREGSIYELGLADVFVTKNVATITNEKITDTRYESDRCGICSSIAKWDTTTIYRQVQSDLAGFKTNEQAEFLAWFDRMKDQLSKDAAGHLQSEIDAANVAISGLDSKKQNKEDNTLDTTAKTIVGAINEHEADITQINSDLSSGLGSISSLISLTSGLNFTKIDFKEQLNKHFMLFDCNSNVPITSNVTMPIYSKGIFITPNDSGISDGMLLAVDVGASLYVAFRNGSAWNHARVIKGLLPS